MWLWLKLRRIELDEPHPPPSSTTLNSSMSNTLMNPSTIRGRRRSKDDSEAMVPVTELIEKLFNDKLSLSTSKGGEGRLGEGRLGEGRLGEGRLTRRHSLDSSMSSVHDSYLGDTSFRRDVNPIPITHLESHIEEDTTNTSHTSAMTALLSKRSSSMGRTVRLTKQKSRRDKTKNATKQRSFLSSEAHFTLLYFT